MVTSHLGSVAQLVERSTENRKVTGSTPVGATRPLPSFYMGVAFFVSRHGRAVVPRDRRTLLRGLVNEHGDEPAIDRGFVTRSFGEPDRTFSCGDGQTVLVYEAPQKLAAIARHYGAAVP
jgi:hypothetical protein